MNKSSFVRRYLFFALIALLIFSPFYNIKSQIKDQPTSSLVYFHPFARKLDLSITRPVIVDQEGCVYLAGTIRGSSRIRSFPIGGDIPGFSTEYNGGWSDGFLIKIDPTGTELLLSTFIGGSKGDSISSICVDDAGMIYIAGYTSSRPEDGFPIGGVIPGYDPTFNSDLTIDFGEPPFDAFVLKLDPMGMKVLYSTYLGGKGYNTTDNMVIDSLGRAHVTGALGRLSTLPQINSKPFIWKENLLWDHEYENEEFANYVILDSNGITVAYSAVLPLHGRLRLNSQDHTIIAGEVKENIFSSLELSESIPGFTQEFSGQQDIGVMILDTTRKEVLAATFLGGVDLEFMDLYVDNSDQLYILGYVNDPVLLNWESEYISVTEGMHQQSGYCFLVKMDSQLETILYASHFESPDRDNKYFWLNMSVDEHEQAYIAGHIPETLDEYSFVMKVDTTAIDLTVSEPVDTASTDLLMFWLIFLIVLCLLLLFYLVVKRARKKVH